MSYKLSNKTKEIISNRIGISYEKLIQMEIETIVWSRRRTKINYYNYDVITTESNSYKRKGYK